MSRRAWSSIFSVGVRSMDDQHMQIIAMINRLSTDPHASVGPDTVADLLTKLTAYARAHFKAEEQLLEEHGYPELEEQKVSHKEYSLKVVALCRGATARLDSVPEELLRFLRDWWTDHILKDDMKYAAFLAERGVT